jgi:hypothetical protein
VIAAADEAGWRWSSPGCATSGTDGFVLGGIALGAAMTHRPDQGVIPQAQAATVMPDQTLVAPVELPTR